MEVNQAASGIDGVREREGSGRADRREQNRGERRQSGTNGLPKHSYWLDLWLFLLFDLVLFIFVYLLPCPWGCGEDEMIECKKTIPLSHVCLVIVGLLVPLAAELDLLRRAVNMELV
ncbi:Uncharacterized protein C4orf3 homolog, partial [Lemmus lemmus]